MNSLARRKQRVFILSTSISIRSQETLFYKVDNQPS